MVTRSGKNSSGEPTVGIMGEAEFNRVGDYSSGEPTDKVNDEIVHQTGTEDDGKEGQIRNELKQIKAQLESL